MRCTHWTDFIPIRSLSGDGLSLPLGYGTGSITHPNAFIRKQFIGFRRTFYVSSKQDHFNYFPFISIVCINHVIGLDDYTGFDTCYDINVDANGLL